MSSFIYLAQKSSLTRVPLTFLTTNLLCKPLGLATSWKNEAIKLAKMGVTNAMIVVSSSNQRAWLTAWSGRWRKGILKKCWKHLYILRYASHCVVKFIVRRGCCITSSPWRLKGLWEWWYLSQTSAQPASNTSLYIVVLRRERDLSLTWLSLSSWLEPPGRRQEIRGMFYKVKITRANTGLIRCHASTTRAPELCELSILTIVKCAPVSCGQSRLFNRPSLGP